MTTAMGWHHDLPKGKMWKGQPFETAQHKLDGWLCTFFKQPKGVVTAFGKDKQQHLEFMQRFPRLHDHPTVIKFRKRAPAYTSMSCEIITGNKRFGVATALIDPKLPIDIVAFAVPYFNGIDCGRNTLGFANLHCIDWDIPFAPYHTTAQLFHVPEAHIYQPIGKAATDHCRANLLRAASMSGVEGYMLKYGGQCGKWYKVKPEPTVDCVITGAIAGEGKYDGQVGSLICSVRDGKKMVEVASASGMTDLERKQITAMLNDNELLGKVVELAYQLKGSKGRLVHPRFKRFRPDKSAHQCTIDQIKE